MDFFIVGRERALRRRAPLLFRMKAFTMSGSLFTCVAGHLASRVLCTIYILVVAIVDHFPRRRTGARTLIGLL